MNEAALGVADKSQLRVLRLGLLQDGMLESQPERQHESRKLEIKRVNFLAADVAQYQRGIIRCQAAPSSNVGDRQAYPL